MNSPIWIPSKDYIESSAMYEYLTFVRKNIDSEINDYQSLWEWSLDHLERFWESLIAYYKINYEGTYEHVLSLQTDEFIGNRWFEGLCLNYSEHIFRNKNKNHIAIIYKNEKNSLREISWGELIESTTKIRRFLVDAGIQTGDRVVGVLNNTPETISLFLAVNSIGAVWSCCSPDFGVDSIIDRFGQLEPKLLFCEGKYRYNGKEFSQYEKSKEIKKRIDSLQQAIIFDKSFLKDLKDSHTDVLEFVKVPFNDPIWILFSSGTTGKPKAITQSVGGILLEHFKALNLHQNVKEGEKFLWYTTTGWMMWNYAVSSFLCGATLVIYDGSISYPDTDVLWDFAKSVDIEHLGAGASFLSKYIPRETNDYMPKTIGSTGSPLPPSSFIELQEVFSKTQIISLSGGTDVCSAFLSGNPLDPVYAGEIQCRTLGSDIIAIDEQGNEIINQVGELVIRQVMPSMPIYFWNDHNNIKYKESYFEKFDGVWCHGDWVKIIENRGIIMFGRSDSTLNKGGVRIGTAEIYNVTETFEEIMDSLVISIENEERNSYMLLFVQLVNDIVLTEQIREAIRYELRRKYSPRHVADFIIQVKEIPYTLSGKKLEIPVKKIFEGRSIEKSVSLEVMKNPDCLQEYVGIRDKLNL